jgi:elongation factor G
MKEQEITRNIGISAHIDSGKTTLTERILYYAGRIHKIEEVRGGGDGATMDFMELEKEKGITITSAATTVFWKDKKINIIDTPGHVDFTVEVERSLRVLDGGIMVLCGVAGVQSQSITVDRQMKRYKVPRLAFINKLDRLGSNPDKVIEDLRSKLNLNAVAVQIPVGLEDAHKGVVDLVTQKAYLFEGEKGEKVITADVPEALKDKMQQKRAEMLEAVSMFDDQMMEDLLEEKEISEESIHKAIEKGVQSLELVPVYMGSAFKNKGVQVLLDAVCRYLPSPIAARTMVAQKLVDGESKKVELTTAVNDPLVCMAFKITEEQFGQLTYTRIYQGTLRKGDTVVNSRTGKKVRVGRMVRMHSDHKENIDVAHAGDIIAMIGIDCASGDTFCSDNSEKLFLENIFIADSVISLAIKCGDNNASDRMSKALAKFVKEDPTFRVNTDLESKETIISGMGELHLDIYIERMQREFKVPVEVGAPQVNYRETIRKNAEYNYIHKKQTGGAGQFAVVIGNIKPLEADGEEIKEFEFNNLVKGGNIPSEYIGACEKGFYDIMQKGPLAAFPMVGVQVNLVDGKYHDVDSSDMAFRICSRNAMKQAVSRADAVLLEPIMGIEVETPTEYQGTVIGDLSSRRGVIKGTETRDNLTIINANAPLSQMFGYATNLRSATAGKATYSMEFERYNPVPRDLQQDIIDARKALLEEEEE